MVICEEYSKKFTESLSYACSFLQITSTHLVDVIEMRDVIGYHF